MLKELLSLYQGTDVVEPVAEGLKVSGIVEMGDCDCVDGDCCNCD